MNKHAGVNAGVVADNFLKATFPEGYAEYELRQSIRRAIETIGKDKTEQAIKEEIGYGKD